MLKTVIGVAVYLLLNGLCIAQADKYLAGVHYLEIARPLNIDTAPGRSGEVWVFFKYSCPACYQFHPHLRTWQATMTEDVVVKKIPVFQPEFYSKAYYAAQQLQLDDQFHLDIYQRIHQHNQPPRSLADVAELATAYGVDAQAFIRMADSFAVSGRINQGIRTAGQAQVPGTPIMVVNGRYLLSGKLVGSNTAMLQVAEYLLGKQPLTGSD